MNNPLEPGLDEPTWVFPFHAMTVGDSFFIPTLRTAYMAYVIDNSAKKQGVAIRVHPVVEDGLLGVRAWRIS
jgi:hypothetical protein